MKKKHAIKDDIVREDDSAFSGASMVLVSVSFLLFETVSLFLFGPQILSGINEWHFIQDGVSAPWYVLLAAAALITALYVLLVTLITMNIRSRRGSWLFRSLAASLLILAITVAVLNRNTTLTKYRDSTRYLILTGDLLDEGFDYAFSSKDGLSTVPKEISSTTIDEIVTRQRIFPGNLYRFASETTQDQCGFAVSGTLFRAYPSTSGMAWNPIERLAIKGTTLCGLYTDLSTRVTTLMRVAVDTSEIKRHFSAYCLSADSYPLYLSGLKKYTRGSENSLDSAIVLLQAMLRNEAESDLARAALADAYCQLYLRLWRPVPSMLDSANLYLGGITASTDVPITYYKARGLYYSALMLYYSRCMSHGGADRGDTKRAVYRDSLHQAASAAIGSYESGLALSGTNPMLLGNYAAAYLASAELTKARINDSTHGNFVDSATTILQSAIHANPFVPALYLNLGVAHLQEWRQDKAKSELVDSTLRCLKLAIEYASKTQSNEILGHAYYNLACLYSMLGDYDNCWSNLQNAISQQSFNATIMMAGDSLLSIEQDKDLQRFWTSGRADLRRIDSTLTEFGMQPIKKIPVFDGIS